MKISTAKSINKKCHSHQRFLASKCECGLPKLNPPDATTHHGDPPAMVIAEELGEHKEQPSATAATA
jgi:hypothetical protein